MRKRVNNLNNYVRKMCAPAASIAATGFPAR
jgi:hypothetical protein